MIRGLLLDLDNTLLDIDVDAFIEQYSHALARRLVPEDPERGLAIVAGASYRLLSDSSGQTLNRDRLLETLSKELSAPVDDLWPRIESLSLEALPALATMAHPIPAARAVVLEARRRGLRTVVATNPIYPRTVIVERLRWAGVEPEEFDHIACLEVCRSAKPFPAYFSGLAQAIGVPEAECLMVGDDPDQDLPAQKTGMAVHLITPEIEAEPGSRIRKGPLGTLYDAWADELPSSQAV